MKGGGSLSEFVRHYLFNYGVDVVLSAAINWHD